MNHRSLYEQVLSKMSAAELPRPSVPRPSAAVVLWRRSGTGIEVYWVRRSESLEFMGGWHAFPGGGLASEDEALVVRGESGRPADGEAASDPWGGTEGEAEQGRPNRIPGLLAAALRELFEETGVLPLGEAGEGGGAGRVEALAQARQRLLAEKASFASLLGELGVTLDASRLVYAGRWITPSFSPLRYDARFFLLEWPEGRRPEPAVIPGELECGEWISPREALARWRQGRVLIPQPVLSILRVLDRKGPIEGLAQLRRGRDQSVSIPRIEFRPEVTLLPLATATLPPASHTHAYLLGNRELVLVDPGCASEDETQKLSAALRAVSTERGKHITAIWVTHHHQDHVGAVETMRALLNVPVCAHAETARRLAEAGIAVDRELADQQAVVLAGEPPVTLRVLHTPGHARGHLCFYEQRLGSLIAGDMVAGAGTIVIDPPEGNMNDYLASLRKLIELRPATLFPSHGPVIANGTAALEGVLAHRLQREEKIFEAWEAGLRTPAAMLPSVYDDVSPRAYPLAERQILAHLERLRSLGRIE